MAVAALALEAGHALERRIAGELNLAFDAATAPRSGGEAVVGQYQFGLMRHVLRDRAQAPIRTEERVLATEYLKGKDGWRIARARFA